MLPFEMKPQEVRVKNALWIFLLPCLSPLLLGLVYFAFPTPPPGPWPYGQRTLIVENIVAIVTLAHLVLSLTAAIVSFWRIANVELRMVFWFLVLLSIPAVLLFGFELSMCKAGKWL